jgi:hypothetical protein
MAVYQLCSSANERAPYRFPRKCEEKSLIERAADVPALELPLLYGGQCPRISRDVEFGLELDGAGCRPRW